MSESTYRVSKKDAIEMLRCKGITVFESDSNERLSFELYRHKENDFENYEVVDYERKDEPINDKWDLWKSFW